MLQLILFLDNFNVVNSCMAEATPNIAIAPSLLILLSFKFKTFNVGCNG